MQYLKFTLQNYVLQLAKTFLLLGIITFSQKLNKIAYPFSEVALPADFSVHETGQFIKLSRYGGLKCEFNKDLLSDFRIKGRAEYELISKRAFNFFIPFSMSYLCQTAMLAIKTNID